MYESWKGGSEMKSRKVRLETVSFYDHTGIAAHLEKMAAKGWMIERIANFGWIYRRIKPKKMHFAVSYFPKASEFDPEPSEAQKTFLEFCAHTGWTLACTSAQMQIFYNDRENPTPIETDPALELQTIHNSCKKTFFPAQILLFILGLVMGAFFVMNVIADPIDILASYNQLVTGVCWLLVIVLSTSEFITYFRWRKCALAAAEQGIFLDTFGTSKLQKASLVILAVMIGYYIINIIFSTDSMMKFVALCMGVYIILLYVGVDGAKQLMKRLKVATGVNRTLTFVVSFVLAFAMVGGITAVALKFNDAGIFDNGEEIRRSGLTFSAETDEIPLRVEDLLEVSYDEYINRLSIDESIFLARYVMHQMPHFDSKPSAVPPTMDYTIAEVKMPWLYNVCKKTLFDKLDDSEETSSPEEFRKMLRKEDASVWGAKEAYRQYYSDGMARNQYLLCYENRLITITFSWEVTDAQKGIVGEKLAK